MNDHPRIRFFFTALYFGHTNHTLFIRFNRDSEGRSVRRRVSIFRGHRPMEIDQRKVVREKVELRIKAACRHLFLFLSCQYFGGIDRLQPRQTQMKLGIPQEDVHPVVVVVHT